MKNLVGRSVSVHVDLSKDVAELSEAVADREGLPRGSLRFVFGGRQLEPGLPLLGYGIGKGSNVHLTSLLRSNPREDTWVGLKVTITTPFAEAEGTLEVPEENWSDFTLSPKVLRGFRRVSDFLGGVFPDTGDTRRRQAHDSIGEDLPLRLCLSGLRAFPCLRAPGAADIWHRLKTLTARIEIHGSLRASLVSNEQKLRVGLLDSDSVAGLALSISLLSDSERLVDNVTEKYLEIEEAPGGEEVCCICLEPMLVGEMLRRLPCLHRLHAGCAMTLLPKARSCPLCRCNIAADFGEDVDADDDADSYESEDDEDEDDDDDENDEEDPDGDDEDEGGSADVLHTDFDGEAAIVAEAVEAAESEDMAETAELVGLELGEGFVAEEGLSAAEGDALVEYLVQLIREQELEVGAEFGREDGPIGTAEGDAGALGVAGRGPGHDGEGCGP